MTLTVVKHKRRRIAHVPTRLQRTEQLAIHKGLIVKKNAVVMDGLMPSGILVRYEHEKEFRVLKLLN